MIGGKKRDDDFLDNGSEISSNQRTEGANAVAFSFPVDGGGFIPHHKDPPRFIRVRTHDKKEKDFDRVFLAQELVGTSPKANPQNEDEVKLDASVRGYHKQDPGSGGPIWTVEFSKDGKYLATGGKDRILRVWAVLATPEDRKAFGEDENASTPQGDPQQHLSAPVFHSKPLREFSGHTGDILDLSWSKNNFLLSSSMDRTVRLWHMSRPECLCTFKHNDFVTSIAFHPRDDRFFLAGSLDATLRLWSIPDKSVAYSSQLSDIITAVAFTPDGKTAIAGCLNGLCIFYETVDLKHITQIHVRSSRGKNARGSKITGIRTMAVPPASSEAGAEDEVKILVTSNDSRIRVYNLSDKSLEVKLKGLENACNQIKASFSDDGKYIICGSEDRKAFIWSMDPSSSELDRDDKRPYEYFEAHGSAVTEAVFAPAETRQLLQASNDPVYTLCNPPPVTLLSKEELETESVPPSDAQSQSEFAAPSKKPPEESPAFIARSAHPGGNIIVTTDHAGTIKVFRQDCAFAKRRLAMDSWDTASSTFSKRRGLARDGLLSRALNRTSASISISSRDMGSGSAPGRAAVLSPVNTEIINTWRHGVHGSNGGAGAGTGHAHLGSSVSITTAASQSLNLHTPTVSERSVSPSKPRRSSPMVSSMQASGGDRRVSRARKSATNGDVNGRSESSPASTPIGHPLSPATSHGTGADPIAEKSPPLSSSREVSSLSSSRNHPPTPSFSLKSIDKVDRDVAGEEDEEDSEPASTPTPRLDSANASPSFWNLSRWKNGGSTAGGRNASSSSALGTVVSSSGGGG